MNTKEKKQIKKEIGQSMVELGVSIFVLLVLLAGVVDLGRLAFYYITLRDSAQEAASYASIFPNNNYEILERAKAGAIADGVDPGNLDVVLRYMNPEVAPEDRYKCSSKEDTTFTLLTNTCGENNVKVGDVIEITVTDNSFPITMPFIGPYIGAIDQKITLETKIQDVVIRVPDCD
jgi:hypothetical protein